MSVIEYKSSLFIVRISRDLQMPAAETTVLILAYKNMKPKHA